VRSIYSLRDLGGRDTAYSFVAKITFEAATLVTDAEGKNLKFKKIPTDALYYNMKFLQSKQRNFGMF